MGTTTFSGPVKSGDILATGGATLGTNIANTSWVNNVASMYMQSPTAGNATELKTVGAINRPNSNDRRRGDSQGY